MNDHGSTILKKSKVTKHSPQLKRHLRQTVTNLTMCDRGAGRQANRCLHAAIGRSRAAVSLFYVDFSL